MLFRCFVFVIFCFALLASNIFHTDGWLCIHLQPRTCLPPPRGRTRPPTCLVYGTSNQPLRTATKRCHEISVVLKSMGILYGLILYGTRKGCHRKVMFCIFSTKKLLFIPCWSICCLNPFLLKIITIELLRILYGLFLYWLISVVKQCKWLSQNCNVWWVTYCHNDGMKQMPNH